MKSLPCPRCGSSSTCGTFCKECLQVVHPMVSRATAAKLVLCATCSKIRMQHVWKDISQHDALVKVCGQALHFSAGACVTSIGVAAVPLARKPGLRTQVAVPLVVTGHQSDATADYEEDYEVTVAYDVTYCPDCGKQGSAYYEGILQVRNQTAKVRQLITNYLLAKKSRGLRLVKEITAGTGTDYFLSDQRAVHHLARHLHSKLGGELKISAQHFSYDHSAGKNLYRVNAYLEIPNYHKGDVILCDNKYYYILGVGTKVKAVNILTGQNEAFVYNPNCATKLPVRTTQVTRVMPLEVLHPVTFQSAAATSTKYAPAEIDLGDNVSVAFDEGYVFLIPAGEEHDVVQRRKKRYSQKRQAKREANVREK